MRILLYSLNYWPELTGIGKYNAEMAEFLVESGHEVTVITAPPYYPFWKIFEGYSAWRFLVEYHKGVKVIRCPLWVPRRLSAVTRILHLLSFAASSLGVILINAFRRPHVIIILEPSLACAPAALTSASLCGAKSWLHVQDYEVDAAFELGFIRGGREKALLLSMEKLIMRRFSRVSTITDKMLERLKSKGVSEEKQILFPNWVDTASIYPLGYISGIRKELGLGENVMVLMYAGNMGEKQGLEIIIEAAKQLAVRKNIVFVLSGSGAALNRLKEAAFGLRNIIWLPIQPFDRLNDLLNTADIHLLPQREDAADLVMPSKLTGIMASGRPVIATAGEGTELSKVIKDRGLVVPPGCVDSMVEAINLLVKSNKLRRNLGGAARKYAVENFDKETVLKRFKKNLMSSVSG